MTEHILLLPEQSRREEAKQRLLHQLFHVSRPVAVLCVALLAATAVLGSTINTISYFDSISAALPVAATHRVNTRHPGNAQHFALESSALQFAAGQVLGASITAPAPATQAPSTAVDATSTVASLVNSQLKRYLSEGLLTGPAGPQGPEGPAGSSDVVQNGNGQTTAVIGGNPIVSYVPSSPASDFTGASIAGFTDLSSGNLTSQTADIQGALTVSGSASIAGGASIGGSLSAATSTLSSLTVSGPVNLTGSTTIAGLNVTGFNPGLTQGSIAFQGATALSQDNANFFYNSTTHSLGLGTSSPSSTLFVQGSGAINPFTIASSTGAQLLTVLANGNVGIGTTTPSRLLTVTGSASIGSTVFVDCSGVDDTAAISNALSSSATDITTTGGNCVVNSVLTIPKGKTLTWGPGTHTISGILFTDSTTTTSGTGEIAGAGVGVTTLFLKANANTDAISQQSFSSLTGTGNDYGMYKPVIRDLTIDGNKTNNISGYGIRLYGRGIIIERVDVQNSAQDGIWTEGNGPNTFSTPNDTAEYRFEYIHTMLNGGNGWTQKASGGAGDIYMNSVVAWGNGGWGIKNYVPIAELDGFDSYQNSSGAWDDTASSGIRGGVGDAFNSAAGYGFLQEAGTAAVSVSDSVFVCGGCTALELHSAVANNISGNITSSAVGVDFNGGSAGMYTLNFTTMTGGTWFKCTSMSGPPFIQLSGNDGSGTIWDASTCAGAAPTTGFTFATSAGTGGVQINLPTRTLHAGGYAPVLPQSNSTMAVMGDASQSGTIYFDQIKFNAGATYDVGLSRNASGVLEINNTVAGTLRDLEVRALDPTYGNVGVGTTSANSKLVIQGAGITSSSAAESTYNASGTLLTTILNNGNVGIGTSAPTSTLFVQGSGATSPFAVASSTGTQLLTVSPAGGLTASDYPNCSGFTTNSSGLIQCTASDERLKQEITPLGTASGLAAINALNPVSFYWQDPTRGTTEQFGFIAQQVQQIFPNLVSTTTPTALTPGGTLTLNYDGLISPLILATQELSASSTAMQSAISTIQNQISGLQNSFGGNATSTGLTVYSPSNFSGDSVGEAEIPAGQTSVRVSFSQPYAFQPIVTLTPTTDYSGHFWVGETDADGFTVEIDQSDLLPLVFNWHSFSSPNEQLTVIGGTPKAITLVVAPSAPADDQQLTLSADSDSSSTTIPAESDSSATSTPDVVDTSTPSSDQDSGDSTTRASARSSSTPPLATPMIVPTPTPTASPTPTPSASPSPSPTPTPAATAPAADSGTSTDQGSDSGS